MDRRSFLLTTVGYSSLNTVARTFGIAFAACPLLPQMANSQIVSPIIDIHCHVFNGHDLPIKNFIKKTVLREIFEKNSFFKLGKGIVNKFLKIATKWVLDAAPSVEKEKNFLDAMKTGQQTLPTRQQIRVREVHLLTNLFKKIKKAGRGPINLGLVRKMIKHLFPENFNRYAGQHNRHFRVTPKQMTKRVFSTSKKENELSKFFKWALMLTRYRFQIIEELSRFHKNKVQLLTPAMIDFDLWLNKKSGDDARSNIPEQINVLRHISKNYVPGEETFGKPVHGFVSFDPLREAFYRKGGAAKKRAKFSPFSQVKEAIRGKGFIGVKVYPPMGFRPLNNEKFRRTDIPRFIRRAYSGDPREPLDKALHTLYNWCQDNNVPILSHARDSNGSDKNHSERADPENWALVTDKYKNLNICLAHMGGFKEAFYKRSKCYRKGTCRHKKPWPKDTWEWHFAKLVQGAGNNPVFGDIGFLLAPYFQNKSPGKRSEIVRLFKKLFEDFNGIEKRLMFGSDWIMLGRDHRVPDGSGDAYHLNDVRNFLIEIGLEKELDYIFGKNAIKFLGLDDGRENTNRYRLLKFYETHQLDGSWLTAISVNPESVQQ